MNNDSSEKQSPLSHRFSIWITGELLIHTFRAFHTSRAQRGSPTIGKQMVFFYTSRAKRGIPMISNSHIPSEARELYDRQSNGLFHTSRAKRGSPTISKQVIHRASSSHMFASRKAAKEGSPGRKAWEQVRNGIEAREAGDTAKVFRFRCVPRLFAVDSLPWLSMAIAHWYRRGALPLR